MTPKNAVILSNVTKQYVLHHEKPTLVEHIITGKNERFTALHDINLTIPYGQKLGIIGSNGSGKTTLLKIIAGITTPTTGTITTNGNIVSLIDIEAGFHPDLTGEQNVFLNGMIMGMSKKEIGKKLDDIIAFSEIGRFIDAPLFTYSSGMILRLGFAVAIHSSPDILLLDEGMDAGDQFFQKKAAARIRLFLRQVKTIIVVSHWMDIIRRNCNRIVILNNGTVTHRGTRRLIRTYERQLHAASSPVSSRL